MVPALIAHGGAVARVPAAVEPVLVCRAEPRSGADRVITVADVEAAGARLRSSIYESPCPASATLGELTGTRCHVKLENLQMTGSFKERGALSKLTVLTADKRRRGVIRASAGNHGLALAYHAQRLGIGATIEWAPLIKVTQCRRHGATVVLSGQDYDEAYAEVRRQEARAPERRPSPRCSTSGWRSPASASRSGSRAGTSTSTSWRG